jgi:hypothetical protein
MALSTNHGGVAIVAVPSVSLSMINMNVDIDSFELLCARVTMGSFCCIVVVIYRPGSIVATPAFFDDLSEILDRIAGYIEPIFIVGDLNVRLDRSDDRRSINLKNVI